MDNVEIMKEDTTVNTIEELQQDTSSNPIIEGTSISEEVPIEETPIIETPHIITDASEIRKRRMRRTTFQSKLGRKLDKITSKVIDNNIRLTSHATDMIRILTERDERTQDVISRTIQETEVMPIILPKLDDIPMRQLKREGSEVLIPSLFTISQQDFFEIYAPIESNLNEDDLLVRIVYDLSPNLDEPYVFVLQVKEILVTLGYSSPMWKKCLATFYDEKLSDKVIKIIRDSIHKRELLQF